MITIRKNSKEFKEVIASTGWNLSALGNGFSGEAVEGDLVEFSNKFTFAKLHKCESRGIYSFDVHSNMWYTKSIN